MRTSAGNTFSWFLNGTRTAFCVVGVNSKGTRPWEYVSSLGGLQPSSTILPGTTLPTVCAPTTY